MLRGVYSVPNQSANDSARSRPTIKRFLFCLFYLAINSELSESHLMCPVCPACHVLKVESTPYQIIKEHPQAIHTRIAL